MKTIAELARGVAGVRPTGPTSVAVRAIVDDSRRACPGALFAALPGEKFDGRRFAGAAVALGAVAVLGAGPRPEELPAAVAYLEADAPRRALAELCRRFFDEPDQRLAIVGVTGTNGKTTTAHLVASAFEATGRRTAVGGTNGLRAGNFSAPGTLTTPEAPALWAFFDRALQEGCAAAAIEASSAALVADRAHAIRFAGAVLTGIGHDHLDTHGSFEAYRDAKTILFRDLAPESIAVLPADDPHSGLFRAATRARVTTFGERSGDWSIDGHRVHPSGASFRLRGPGFDDMVETRRPGPWDARNLAAAVAVATALGADPATAVHGAASLHSVDGRWESVDAGQDFAAIVDYAHTPEALERTLALLRRMTVGRVLVVFGCGGDRDRHKRPEMGRIAGAYADVVLVTEDNPRSEDPDAIADEVLAGLRGSTARVERVRGRAAAIDAAVAAARAGDAVLVTGKGHETYQEIGGVRHPFDDRAELRRALAARGAA